MPFPIVNKDILEALEFGEIDLMLHVVNCQGVMSRGLALQVKQQHPPVFNSYRSLCEVSKASSLLGEIQEVDGIVNMFAQEFYGTKRKQLDYDKLVNCLWEVYLKNPTTLKIGIPYNMGCGLAGGDWDKVNEIISCILKDRQVVYYKID